MLWWGMQELAGLKASKRGDPAVAKYPAQGGGAQAPPPETQQPAPTVPAAPLPESNSAKTVFGWPTSDAPPADLRRASAPARTSATAAPVRVAAAPSMAEHLGAIRAEVEATTRQPPSN